MQRRRSCRDHPGVAVRYLCLTGQKRNPNYIKTEPASSLLRKQAPCFYIWLICLLPFSVVLHQSEFLSCIWGKKAGTSPEPYPHIPWFVFSHRKRGNAPTGNRFDCLSSQNLRFRYSSAFYVWLYYSLISNAKLIIKRFGADGMFGGVCGYRPALHKQLCNCIIEIDDSEKQRRYLYANCYL